MAEENIEKPIQLMLTKENYESIETAFEDDLWERRLLGEHLTRYVDRLNVGAVLALDARWGEGKTWFARHWRKHLQYSDHQVIYLDAFANDYLEDPFLIISAEIANTLESNVDPTLLASFKETAAKAFQVLLPNLPQLILGLGLNFIGAGFLSSTVQKAYENGEKLIDDLAESFSEQIKENIEKKIEDYETEKQSLNSFKDSLRDLATNLEKPLVFIIDELDRCRPDFSIRLIERIKHFFDIPNIIFVLVMDKTQLTNVICHKYGYDNKVGEEYLDKFIDFTIALKTNESNKKEKYEKIIIDMLKNLGVDDDKDHFKNLQNDILVHCMSLNISIRQLKKKLNSFSLLALDTCLRNQILLAFLFLEHDIKLEQDAPKILLYLINYYKNFLEYSGFKEEIEYHLESGRSSGRILDTNEYYADFLKSSFKTNFFASINSIYKFSINKHNHPIRYLNQSIYLPLERDGDFKTEWENYLKTGL